MDKLCKCKKLKYFKSFKHQTKTDLIYGTQQKSGERLLTKDRKFRDYSITGNWTPSED